MQFEKLKKKLSVSGLNQSRLEAVKFPLFTHLAVIVVVWEIAYSEFNVC